MNVSATLCWLGLHRWVSKLHFTPESMLDWRGCDREGCNVGWWVRSNCTYYGPDCQDIKE